MDKFLEKYILSKLYRKKQKNSNSSICIFKIEFIIKTLTTKKTLDIDGFTHKFDPSFKEKTRISITLIPKPDKDIIRKKNY